MDSWLNSLNRLGWPGISVDSVASPIETRDLPASLTYRLSGFFTSLEVKGGPQGWYRIFFLVLFLVKQLKNVCARLLGLT